MVLIFAIFEYVKNIMNVFWVQTQLIGFRENIYKFKCFSNVKAPPTCAFIFVREFRDQRTKEIKKVVHLKKKGLKMIYPNIHAWL